MSTQAPTSDALSWRGHYFGAKLTDGKRNIGSVSYTSQLAYKAEIFIPGTRDCHGRRGLDLGHFATNAEARSALLSAHAQRMLDPAAYDAAARCLDRAA